MEIFRALETPLNRQTKKEEIQRRIYLETQELIATETLGTSPKK